MTRVLVDTSVWRHFFIGRGNAQDRHALEALLDEDGELLTHDAIIGELVLGGLGPRQEMLLERLPKAPPVTDAEVIAFIKHRKLMRRGIGWVDVHLLASALVAPATFWSADSKLSDVATELAIAFSSKSRR